MWLANLTAALDLDDDLPNDQVPPIDPNTEDGTLVSEISKFGGTLLSEGGALLKEMNTHVFSGAVADMLAPATTPSETAAPGSSRKATTTAPVKHQPRGPQRMSVPKTVALCGSDAAHAVEIARRLARAGHNVAVAAPSKVASGTLGAFNAVAGRKGRSIAVMPESAVPAHRRDRLCLSEGEVPIFVQPRSVFRTLVHSCDLVLILGDDARVIAELTRLRGVGVASVRLSSSGCRRSAAGPFGGSTVATVDDAMEHVEVVLASPPTAATTAGATEATVTPAVDSDEDSDGSDDALATYEVVDYDDTRAAHGGRR